MEPAAAASGARAPAAATPTLAFVIPALEEGATIGPAIAAVARDKGPGDEVIVVDGGSADGTATAARDAGASVLQSPRGRAVQMNAGARAARADALVFLHADTRLPDGGAAAIRSAIGAGATWGHFGVRLDGAGVGLRLVEWGIRIREALGGTPSGDQAFFVRRDVFLEGGGFPELPLMEDLALADRLRRRAPAHRIATPASTSARRWTRDGIARTVILMWCLRSAYRLGVAPERLARWYRDVR
jgi:rSAM/selenodomain-associated transferase 2